MNQLEAHQLLNSGKKLSIKDFFDASMAESNALPQPSVYHLPYVGKTDRDGLKKYNKFVSKYMKENNLRLIDMDEYHEREIAKLYLN